MFLAGQTVNIADVLVESFYPCCIGPAELHTPFLFPQIHQILATLSIDICQKRKEEEVEYQGV